MTGLRRLIPAAILLAGCALLATVREQRAVALRAPLTGLPSEIAGLRGVDREIGAEERRVAGVSDYVLRTFGAPSAGEFSVYVGYYDSQRQGKTIHSPKNCLPGSGWTALLAGTDTVRTAAGEVTVNRYIVTNGESRALVYYWYQGRGRVVANEYLVKWNLLRDAMTLRRTEEALVRVVVPLGWADATREARERADASAAALARSAARTLIPAVDRALPPRTA